MPCKAAADCRNCGAEQHLIQCHVCSDRLKEKGTSLALCKTCIENPTTLAAHGKRVKEGDSVHLHCSSCVAYLERLEQEKLFQRLKGPDPDQILRIVTQKFPWALTIANATPEDQLEALQFLKRQLSGHRTVQALAETLAASNHNAALLIHQLGSTIASGSSDSINNKVLRTFVKKQCPTIKYKTLLMPPGGSIYKATRHFQDMLKVEDPLVAAMAEERLFLIERFEAMYRPQTSSRKRKVSEREEMPEAALHLLRSTFKSISNKIKSAASIDDEANTMLRMWYSDHLDWAQTWSQICRPDAAASSSVAVTSRAIVPWTEPAQAEPTWKGEKGKAKGK